MSTTRSVLMALAIFAVFASLFFPVSLASSAPQASSSDTVYFNNTETKNQVQQDSIFDFTTYKIHIHSDTNATWTVEYQVELGTQQEVDGFENYRARYESGKITPFEGLERMETVVEDAENVTGRNMSFEITERDVLIEDTVTGKRGIARAVFNWTNFANTTTKTEGTYIKVGDVFAGGGFAISKNMRLVIKYDKGLKLDSVLPEPQVSDSRTLQWDGKVVFGEGRPSLTLLDPGSGSENGDGTTNTDGTGGSGSDGSANQGDGSSSNGGTPGSGNGTQNQNPVLLIVAFLLILSAFILGAYMGRRIKIFERLRLPSQGEPTDGGRDKDLNSTSKTTQPKESSTSSEVRSVNYVHPEGSVSGTKSETESPTQNSEKLPSEDTVTKEEQESSETTSEGDELLTDEDRIVRLLEENGGRMKQADIVDSTGWSKSKVSMVLSDMEDDGVISKLRLGRENVIDLETD